ncbi:hypothetical protein BGY98DRAFT_483268 [Russula aff. rugulosa BPL654]|nr:hypothetical protein BGY98DRAFT_483268 [Russula aff. rugulosa BPL654]
MRQVKEKYSTTSALACLVFSLLTHLLLYCGNVPTCRRLAFIYFFKYEWKASGHASDPSSPPDAVQLAEDLGIEYDTPEHLVERGPLCAPVAHVDRWSDGPLCGMPFSGDPAYLFCHLLPLCCCCYLSFCLFLITLTHIYAMMTCRCPF